MNVINQQHIVIATNGSVTGGTLSFPYIGGKYVPDNQYYVIDTGTSLSGSANIVLSSDPSITPQPNMQCHFRYMGQISTITNGATVTILGKTLTNAQAGQQLNIVATYALSSETNTAQWIVSIVPLTPASNNVQGLNELPIVLSGQTKTLLVGTDKAIQSLNWSGTLTGSNSITGTALNGIGQFTLLYNGNVTIGSYAITLFGYTLTAAQAKSQLTIEAVWDNTGSAWVVSVTAGLQSQPINYVGLSSYTITGASQVSQTLTPGVSHQTFELKGSGVTLSGNYAVTLATPSSECSFQIVVPATLTLGVYTLTIAGLVIPAWMALQGGYSVFAWWDSTASAWVTQLVPPYTVSAPSQVYSVKVVLSSVQILALQSSPQTLIAAQGSGTIIDPIDIMGAINYSTAAYATNTTFYIGHNNGGTFSSYYSDAYLLPSTVTLNARKLTPVIPANSTTQQSVANSPLIAYCTGSNPATGAGSISLYISFLITTL